MTEKLLERLDALGEAAETIRTKASGRMAKKLDQLVLAEVLLFVDKTATKLAALERQLQAGLFDGQGQESA